MSDTEARVLAQLRRHFGDGHQNLSDEAIRRAYAGTDLEARARLAVALEDFRRAVRSAVATDMAQLGALLREAGRRMSGAKPSFRIREADMPADSPDHKQEQPTAQLRSNTKMNVKQLWERFTIRRYLQWLRVKTFAAEKREALKAWLGEELWLDDGRKGATHFHWHIGPRWYLFARITALVVLLGLSGFVAAVFVLW